MNINSVIVHLRKHCPLFADRVGGGLDYDAIADSAKLAVPAAYVVFSGDDPEPNALQNGMQQVITDEFHVLVVLANPDERGQQAAVDVVAVRAELLRALAGWSPSSRHDPVEYDGCKLMELNRARALYLFAFKADWQLGSASMEPPDEPETWYEVEKAGLPELTGIDVGVDLLDPNHAPDGVIEHRLSIEFPPA